MKLNSKKELIAITILVILTAIPIALSLTRTISDTQDTKENIIWNSKGNQWKLSGNNIQTAIDDLDGGMVWVGGDVDLSDPIYLKDHVTINFLNNRVYLQEDEPFVQVEDCVGATIKNVGVEGVSNQTAPMIKLYTAPGSNASVSHNTFKNIQVYNGGPWTPLTEPYPNGWDNYNYDAILMEVHSGEMNNNEFQWLYLDGGTTAIHLKMPGNEGVAEHNYFENIWIRWFTNQIWFEVAPSAQGFNYNIFSHVKSQSNWRTEYGTRDISGKGNHFEHILWWDWYLPDSTGYATCEWCITEQADNTHICAHIISSGYCTDNSTSTTFCNNQGSVCT